MTTIPNPHAQAMRRVQRECLKRLAKIVLTYAAVLAVVMFWLTRG